MRVVFSITINNALRPRAVSSKGSLKSSGYNVYSYHSFTLQPLYISRYGMKMQYEASSYRSVLVGVATRLPTARISRQIIRHRTYESTNPNLLMYPGKGG